MTWDISRTRLTNAAAGWRIARINDDNRQECSAHWTIWPNGAETLSINLRAEAGIDAMEAALIAIIRLRAATLAGDVRTLADAADLLDKEG